MAFLFIGFLHVLYCGKSSEIFINKKKTDSNPFSHHFSIPNIIHFLLQLFFHVTIKRNSLSFSYPPQFYANHDRS